MNSEYFIIANLLNPPILFFLLGIICGLLKSDLQIPDSTTKFLFIYLLIAIGFKGGVSLTNINLLNSAILSIIISGILVSFLTPFVAYKLLRSTSNLDRYTISAIAASYGSVSIVTFTSATNLLHAEQIKYDSYMVAVLVLMEVPAIFSGLILARKNNISKFTILKQIATKSSILLLIGSLIIGSITGNKGLETLEGLLLSPFQGLLCIFLLGMGLEVSKNFNKNCSINRYIISFGLYMPLIGAIVGLLISKLLGLSVSNGFLFSVLCASASYIAVPAAMKLALPEAKSDIYIPMSLSITFPFNIMIGIPLYYSISKLIL